MSDQETISKPNRAENFMCKGVLHAICRNRTVLQRVQISDSKLCDVTRASTELLGKQIQVSSGFGLPTALKQNTAYECDT